MIGLVLICFGATNSLFSFLSGRIARYTGREIIFVTGQVCRYSEFGPSEEPFYEVRAFCLSARQLSTRRTIVTRSTHFQARQCTAAASWRYFCGSRTPTSFTPSSSSLRFGASQTPYGKRKSMVRSWALLGVGWGGGVAVAEHTFLCGQTAVTIQVPFCQDGNSSLARCMKAHTFCSSFVRVRVPSDPRGSVCKLPSVGVDRFHHFVRVQQSSVCLHQNLHPNGHLGSWYDWIFHRGRT